MVSTPEMVDSVNVLILEELQFGISVGTAYKNIGNH